MAGKVIDDSPNGVLILIIPLALAIVLLFAAWPLLLVLVLLGGALNVWQRYQWLKWSQQLDPTFHTLIGVNEGCLTAFDLAMKANISGTTAKRYLDTKAKEFGIRAIEYEDKGTVYYFTSGRTLNRLLDESESPKEVAIAPSMPSAQTPVEAPVETEQSEPAPLTASAQTPVEAQVETEQSEPAPLTTEADVPPALTEAPPEQQQQPTESHYEEEPESVAAEQPAKKLMPFGSLIQIELANRLGVHSSTVYKRRYDSDFPQWSKSRDPQGIAWEYSEDTKEFYPQETQSGAKS